MNGLSGESVAPIVGIQDIGIVLVTVKVPTVVQQFNTTKNLALMFPAVSKHVKQQ